MVLARDVVGFETRGPVRAVLFEGGGEIEARAVIVATGVSYRRLDGARARRAHRARRLLRRQRQRGQPVRGRRRLRRRRGQLRRPGGAEPRPLRQARRAARPGRRRSRPPCRSTSSTGSVGRQHRGAAPDRGRRRARATATSRRSRCSTATPARTEDVRDELAVRLHRRLAPHRLARRRRSPATTTGFVRHRPGPRRRRRVRRLAAGDGRRSPSRPACPACSRPATCASTR